MGRSSQNGLRHREGFDSAGDTHYPGKDYTYDWPNTWPSGSRPGGGPGPGPDGEVVPFNGQMINLVDAPGDSRIGAVAPGFDGDLATILAGSDLVPLMDGSGGDGLPAALVVQTDANLAVLHLNSQTPANASQAKNDAGSLLSSVWLWVEGNPSNPLRLNWNGTPRIYRTATSQSERDKVAILETHLKTLVGQTVPYRLSITNTDDGGITTPPSPPPLPPLTQIGAWEIIPARATTDEGAGVGGFYPGGSITVQDPLADMVNCSVTTRDGGVTFTFRIDFLPSPGTLDGNTEIIVRILGIDVPCTYDSMPRAYFNRDAAVCAPLLAALQAAEGTNVAVLVGEAS